MRNRPFDCFTCHLYLWIVALAPGALFAAEPAKPAPHAAYKVVVTNAATGQQATIEMWFRKEVKAGEIIEIPLNKRSELTEAKVVKVRGTSLIKPQDLKQEVWLETPPKKLEKKKPQSKKEGDAKKDEKKEEQPKELGLKLSYAPKKGTGEKKAEIRWKVEQTLDEAAFKPRFEVRSNGKSAATLHRIFTVLNPTKFTWGGPSPSAKWELSLFGPDNKRVAQAPSGFEPIAAGVLTGEIRQVVATTVKLTTTPVKLEDVLKSAGGMILSRFMTLQNRVKEGKEVSVDLKKDEKIHLKITGDKPESPLRLVTMPKDLPAVAVEPPKAASEVEFIIGEDKVKVAARLEPAKAETWIPLYYEVTSKELTGGNVELTRFLAYLRRTQLTFDVQNDSGHERTFKLTYDHPVKPADIDRKTPWLIDKKEKHHLQIYVYEHVEMGTDFANQDSLRLKLLDQLRAYQTSKTTADFEKLLFGNSEVKKKVEAEIKRNGESVTRYLQALQEKLEFGWNNEGLAAAYGLVDKLDRKRQSLLNEEKQYAALVGDSNRLRLLDQVRLEQKKNALNLTMAKDRLRLLQARADRAAAQRAAELAAKSSPGKTAEATSASVGAMIFPHHLWRGPLPPAEVWRTVRATPTVEQFHGTTSIAEEQLPLPIGGR